jgi:hypothetical protein
MSSSKTLRRERQPVSIPRRTRLGKASAHSGFLRICCPNWDSILSSSEARSGVGNFGLRRHHHLMLILLFFTSTTNPCATLRRERQPVSIPRRTRLGKASAHSGFLRM